MFGKSKAMAQAFRQAVEAMQMTFGHHTIHTTVSVGVAELLPVKEQAPQTLISRADDMLYAC